MLRRRAGRLLDPGLVDAFLSRADELLEPARQESVWDVVLEAEPQPRPWIPPSRLPDLARAFADFADLQSVFTLRHSTDVAELAQVAGTSMGLDSAQVTLVQQAGLMHSLGRVSVSNAIWEKRGKLTGAERERVQLYPHFTERVLDHAAMLKPLSRLASATQERLDGSGYHRGLPASMLPASERVLAAADVYRALLEENLTVRR